VGRERERLRALQRHLRDPRHVLAGWRLRVDELGERSQRALATALRLSRERLRGAGERLNALSPLAVLQRGYSITRREADGAVVRAAGAVSPGSAVRLTFARGWATAQISESHEDEA
jgi:exodeoxyribonuclease VII large subunit